MIDVSKIEKLMAMMKEHGIEMVQAESPHEKILLSKHVISPPTQHIASQGLPVSDVNTQITAPPLVLVKDTASAVATPSTSVPAGQVMKSPFVGTFYRSSSPDNPPFTDRGQRVTKGQALCIVEAMKLMNEIECEFDGVVIDILVENGKLVEFGTPLFVIG